MVNLALSLRRYLYNPWIREVFQILKWMCSNIIPVNRAGLVVELVLTRCHWEKGRRDACNDLYEMYCGLSSWLGSSSTVPELTWTTGCLASHFHAPVGAQCVDFSYWCSSFRQEEPLWASHQTKEIKVHLQVKNYSLSVELIMRYIKFFIFGQSRNLETA